MLSFPDCDNFKVFFSFFCLKQPISFKFDTSDVVCVPCSDTYIATSQGNADDVSLGGLDVTEQVTLLVIGDPTGLLRVVRFRLIDTLLLQRHEQIRGGILILLVGNWLRHVGFRERGYRHVFSFISARLPSCEHKTRTKN